MPTVTLAGRDSAPQRAGESIATALEDDGDYYASLHSLREQGSEGREQGGDMSGGTGGDMSKTGEGVEIGAGAGVEMGDEKIAKSAKTSEEIHGERELGLGVTYSMKGYEDLVTRMVSSHFQQRLRKRTNRNNRINRLEKQRLKRRSEDDDGSRKDGLDGDTTYKTTKSTTKTTTKTTRKTNQRSSGSSKSQRAMDGPKTRASTSSGPQTPPSQRSHQDQGQGQGQGSHQHKDIGSDQHKDKDQGKGSDKDSHQATTLRRNKMAIWREYVEGQRMRSTLFDTPVWAGKYDKTTHNHSI